jgi:hypothetical protein
MSFKPSLWGSSAIVYKTCLEMAGRKQVLLVPVLQFPGSFMTQVCDVSTRKPTESADPACCKWCAPRMKRVGFVNWQDPW